MVIFSQMLVRANPSFKQFLQVGCSETDARNSVALLNSRCSVLGPCLTQPWSRWVRKMK